MRLKPPLIGLMGLLLGAAALPPSDCGAPPPPSRTAAAPLEPQDLASVTIGPPATRPGDARGGGGSCGMAGIPAGMPAGSLRNDSADILHGLQPSEQIRSPLDAAPPGYR